MLFRGDRVVGARAEHLEILYAQLVATRRARLLRARCRLGQRWSPGSAPRTPPRSSPGTSFLDRTPCTIPEPSRTTTKAILPLDRVVTTHPRTVTVSPTCARSPLICTAAMPYPMGE